MKRNKKKYRRMILGTVLLCLIIFDDIVYNRLYVETQIPFEYIGKTIYEDNPPVGNFDVENFDYRFSYDRWRKRHQYKWMRIGTKDALEIFLQDFETVEIADWYEYIDFATHAVFASYDNPLVDLVRRNKRPELIIVTEPLFNFGTIYLYAVPHNLENPYIDYYVQIGGSRIDWEEYISNILPVEVGLPTYVEYKEFLHNRN